MYYFFMILIFLIGCVKDEPTYQQEPQPNFEEAYLQLEGLSYAKEQKYITFEEYRAEVEGVNITDPVIAGRKVRLATPAEYQGSLPLVISLHGLGGNTIFQNHFFNATRLIAKMKFILVIPPGLRKSWDFKADKTRDREFIFQLVKELKGKVAINEKKVFLVGHSNGAIFALNHLCKTKHLAGVVAIGGLANFNLSKCRSNPTAVTFIHGLEDTIVKYAYGRYSFRKLAEFNGCDLTVVDKSTFTLGGMPGTFEKYRSCSYEVSTVFYTLDKQDHTTSLPLKLVEAVMVNLLQLEKPF